MAQVEINAEAPDFCLMDLAGEKVCLSHYRDQGPVVLVLNRGLT
jgi:peroxiredoxin